MKIVGKDKIFFACDIHLGLDFFGSSQVRERCFVDWLDAIKDEARALYLLGDIFDFWFEYKRVVPRGFTRFLGKVAEMHDHGTEIHFFTGNHDVWMFDYLTAEVGAIIHREPLLTEIEGKVFYLAHGDGLGDRSFLFKSLRFVFRNRFCQFLFSCFPTKNGIDFAHLWSKYNRKRRRSNPSLYFGRGKEQLVFYAKNYLKQCPSIDYFIFGHCHILLDLPLNVKTRILIAGDWLCHFSYIVFDGKTLTLEQYEREKFLEGQNYV